MPSFNLVLSQAFIIEALDDDNYPTWNYQSPPRVETPPGPKIFGNLFPVFFSRSKKSKPATQPASKQGRGRECYANFNSIDPKT